MVKEAIPGTLLGGGADITGRLVQYRGAVWTVTRKLRHLGAWAVERQEPRRDGVVQVIDSIYEKVLDERHPDFAELVPFPETQ